MASTHRDTIPYWLTSANLPRFNALSSDVTADVAIVGGGITGLTTACLLAKAGRRVVVLERHRCGLADTGHTTAHLTMATDVRLRDLVRTFGRDHAQAVWDAGMAAIATIEAIVGEHRIDAGFGRVNGYLHVRAGEDASGDSIAHFQEEALIARAMGFDVDYLDTVPLLGSPGLRLARQARIHPRRYLAGLAEVIRALGGQIYEQSGADTFARSPTAVTARGYTVSCADIVMATHNPQAGLAGLVGATMLQTKLALYSSYVVAGHVASGTVPDALWWDTGDPYCYLRVESQADRDLVIFGGEDHKTGQGDPEAAYERLEAQLAAIVPGVEVAHRWSGQVIETADGLPCIGLTAEHQYVATGYAGNGLTFGTLAGILIADAILGRSNPWARLFEPDRSALAHGAWDYLAENADYPYYMLRDRLVGTETQTVDSIGRGEGAIVERAGATLAAYRDEAGLLTLRSAVCPHMGCIVRWNETERTWDCPCHGSRFTPGGDVLAGPAERPLAEVPRADEPRRPTTKEL